MTADIRTRRIPIADIEIGKRLRPADRAWVDMLKTSIAARGLRTPIEVAPIKGGRYRLVAGLHRITACTELAHPDIDCCVTAGNVLEQRRDEILENLERYELTKLDRAIFLAELKRLHLEMFPEAGHGGDRRSDDFQVANMAGWSVVAMDRTGWTQRTLERATAIGERLTPEIADALRSTDIQDNQKELEALSRFGPAIQRRVVKLIKDGKVKSVAAAHRHLDGGPAPEAEDPDDKALKRLLDAWNRTPKKAVRDAFLREIGATLVEQETA